MRSILQISISRDTKCVNKVGFPNQVTYYRIKQGIKGLEIGVFCALSFVISGWIMDYRVPVY